MDEYLALLEKVNLQVQSMEVSETITQYKNKAALMAYVRPLMNFIDHLTPALQEEFIEDVATQQIIESNLHFPDGSLGLRTVKIEVIAFNSFP